MDVAAPELTECPFCRGTKFTREGNLTQCTACRSMFAPMPPDDAADTLAAITAERDALRGAVDAIETMTATGDGLSPDETVAVHMIASAALDATKDQRG